MRASEAPEEHRARVNGVELASFEWRRDLRGCEEPILLVHEFQHGREVHLVQHTYFLPIEAPELVARYVPG